MLAISQNTITRPLLFGVKFIVFSVAQQLQVFYSVVSLITIYMMYMLTLAKNTTYMLLHYISMLKHSLSGVYPLNYIAIRCHALTTTPVGVIIARHISSRTFFTAIYSFIEFGFEHSVTKGTFSWLDSSSKSLTFLYAKLTDRMSIKGRAFMRTKLFTLTRIVLFAPVTVTIKNNRHIKDYIICTH
jgi:hypothetical protein